MTCEMNCSSVAGLYRCECVRCGQVVSVRRLPVHATCVPQGRVAAHSRACFAGTALKSLLATLGIATTPNCSCVARAGEMDRRGCEWCESNIDTIVGWLREEAEKRGLPFVDLAGRLLVRRAIKNARRAAAS